MTAGEHKQEPLPGFGTIEALEEFLVPAESDDDADPNNPYTLNPEDFIDAVASLGSVEFRKLIYFKGLLLNPEAPDSPEGGNANLIISTNGTHEQQAWHLVQKMAHIVRRNADFGTDIPIEQYVNKSIEEIEELFPGTLSNRDKAKIAENIKVQLISEAAKRFYKSHTDLARLALCYLQDKQSKKS